MGVCLGWVSDIEQTTPVPSSSKASPVKRYLQLLSFFVPTIYIEQKKGLFQCRRSIPFNASVIDRLRTRGCLSIRRPEASVAPALTPVNVAKAC